MAESSKSLKGTGGRGEDGDEVLRRPLGAEGGALQETGHSPSNVEAPQMSDAMKEYLGCRKKTFTGRSTRGTSKENVPPHDARENLVRDKGPSPRSDRQVLQEKILSPSADNELDTSRGKKKGEEKIFNLKKVNFEVSAKFVAPPDTSESDENTPMDFSNEDSTSVITIHGAVAGPPKPKKDPRDNLGNFYQMATATSVSDLWAFDEFIRRSGAFIFEETERTKSYKCHERFMIPPEDAESDLEKAPDYDECEDFMNLASGVNFLGGAMCTGHFKIHKLKNQIYRVKTSSDSYCNRCQLMVPIPGLTPSQALLLLKNKLHMEPFIEEFDDNESFYKVAWIHKRFGERITADCHNVFILSKFDDCVSVSVEVSSNIMRRDIMFFPFAYLVGNDLSEEDIKTFLRNLIEKCNISNCSYILTSNHHDMFASICSSCFWDSVKILPNFFMVVELLRESWLGKDRGICDFDNLSAFIDYVEKVRVAIGKTIFNVEYPSVEKALEHSVGLEYCELPNIKQIIKAGEDYVKIVHEAGIFDHEFEIVSSKVDYILSLEFIAKQPFETKIRFLDNCSTFRGHHIALMLPSFVN